MRKRYNLIRRLTDCRRHSKDGKTALAVYLGIKLNHSNSIHYGMTVKEIKHFFRCGTTKACTILRIIKEDTELFTCNSTKNTVFANSCKSEEIKQTKGKFKQYYRGDDVIKIDIPQCYLDHSGTLSLKELVKLIERALILKEYDEGADYKSYAGGAEANHCESEPKSQAYVSKTTGLSRTSLGRRLKEMIHGNELVKLTEKHLERCHKDDKGAFRAVNKQTRLEYYLKAAPVIFAIATAPCSFTHVIWDSPKRVQAQHLKSDKRLRQEVVKESCKSMTAEEIKNAVNIKQYYETLDLYS